MANVVSAVELAARSLAELVTLRGRVAVVTGAARGIGLAISHRLAEAGATVALVDREGALVEQAAADVATRHGVDTVAFAVDISDERAVDMLADSVSSRLGPPHIWVNNAGIYPAASLIDTDLQLWSTTLDVNLTGAFLCSRAAARQMMASDDEGAVIINVSSVSGLRGRPRLSAYSASKHGVTGLTRALAVELGPVGIRVMGVAPSVVDTPGMRGRREAASAEELERLTAFEDSLATAIPLGRAAVPDDVARIVLFCASDLAAFMTGSILPADGGLTAG